MVRSDVQHAAPDKNWLTPQGSAHLLNRTSVIDFDQIAARAR
jgi:hypothetical protein